MIRLTFSFCASAKISAKIGITPNLKNKSEKNRQINCLLYFHESILKNLVKTNFHEEEMSKIDFTENLREFSLTHFCQKFRESNGFTNK